jgi:Holliday junction resolvasome RuvABC DNA-binding subunit
LLASDEHDTKKCTNQSFFCPDTGGLAQMFFAEKNREFVLELYEFDDDDQKDKFRKFLQACSVTLRIMSQAGKVDTEALRTHNIKTDLMRKDLFDWMKG